MGQGQSTADGQVPEEARAKTDYYELLGLDRQASDEEIKKAYRRKALELHPDRNYGNVEDATSLFAEIQSAYEVLSDPQERAWYDSHRDILLRGDQGAAAPSQEYSYNTRMTSADDVLNLMLKYNGRPDYSDSPSGFYAGLEDFFGRLAKEEDIACHWEDLEPMDYPNFGHRDDSYDDVVRPFYAAWNGFATKKSYSWKDQYRLSDAPDRRIRRLMEKENKKIREDAVREYNDAVRSLISFVRKRDPRFQENQKSEAERQKILRDAAAANAARARAARKARLEELDTVAVPDWAQSRVIGEHDGGFSSESEAEEHEYECIVCDKVFKSEAQLNAHEKSKKHVKLVKQLRREMREEDADLDLADKVDGFSSAVEADSVSLHSKDEVGKPPDDPRVVDPSAGADSQSLERGDQGKESQKDHFKPKPIESDSSPASDDDYAPRAEVVDRLTPDTPENLSSKLKSTTLDDDTPATSDTESSAHPSSKVGKAKLKRAKKAAQKVNGGGSEKVDAEFTCAVCQNGFTSKTNLFKHIKNVEHAAPVAQIRGSGGRAGKGKMK